MKPLKPMLAALDYETEYDDDYSVTQMGAINYAMDPRFCCYCVSIACSDGRTFSGKPMDAPWEWLHGATVIAANVLFEQSVSYRLKLDGIFPADVEPAEWQDVLDLCAYLCFSRRRGLKFVAKAGLGITVSKDPRTKAKGVTAEEFWSNDVMWEEICDYCLEDSMIALALWMKYEDRWPAIEREVARITRQGAITGIYLDMPALTDARGILQAKIDECKADMPWVQRGEKPMSIPQFRATCEGFGLDPAEVYQQRRPGLQGFHSREPDHVPMGRVDGPAPQGQQDGEGPCHHGELQPGQRDAHRPEVRWGSHPALVGRRDESPEPQQGTRLRHQLAQRPARQTGTPCSSSWTTARSNLAPCSG